MSNTRKYLLPALTFFVVLTACGVAVANDPPELTLNIIGDYVATGTINEAVGMDIAVTAQGVVELVYTHDGTGRVEIWDTNKTAPLEGGGTEENPITVDVTNTVRLWVRGAAASSALNDVTITGTLREDTKNDKVTVFDVAITTPATFPAYVVKGEELPLDCTISPAGATGGTYQWSKVTGSGTVTFGTPEDHDTTFSADAVGTYTVMVEYTQNNPLNSSTASDISGEIHVVGVDHIEVFAGGSWHEKSSIVILKGTKYTFKAVPTPAGSWPSGKPVWSGEKSGTGATIEVTFEDEEATSLTATCGDSKQIAIDAIVPTIACMEFVSDTGVNHYQIYDNTGTPIYCGWETYPSTYSNPGCFRQGQKSAVKVQFWHSMSLSFDTEVKVWGNVHWLDEYIVGGDYAETNMTFGTSWRSPSPGANVLSEDTVDQKIDYDKDTDITWQYKVTWGTNDWIDAGDTNDLIYYRIYGAPKYGAVPGTGIPGVRANGAFGNQHFTVAHIDYATDLAEGVSAPVTPASIASEIVDERGDISINDNHTHHNLVNTMWEYFKTGDNGQCGCYASGFAYVLRCLGIDSNVAYVHLDTAINSDIREVSGVAFCPVCGPPTHWYGYYGERWWAYNRWQGCCYITASGATTTCYDPQHELVEPYWKIGNDEDGGTSGAGCLYDYEWRSQFGESGQEQSGTTTGACGHTLTVTKTPNYNGN